MLGVFLWPATILTLAVGGGVRGLRPDLIVMTVARAIGPYLAIWLMLSVAGGLLVLPGIAEEYGLFDAIPVLGGGRSWPAHVLISVFSGYLLIVIMRTIGLFYRHFKADFAWSAE